MTAEQVARFVAGDCQDPALRAQADRELDARFAEAMRDPAFKAQWDASMQAFTDRFDDEIAAKVYGEVFHRIREASQPAPAPAKTSEK